MYVHFDHEGSIREKENFIQTKVLCHNLLIQYEANSILLEIKNEIILFEGDLYYFDDGIKFEYLSTKSSSFISSLLTKIILENGFEYCQKHLEGAFTLLVATSEYFSIYGDKLKRRELFYYQTGDTIVADTNLTSLLKSIGKRNYDQNVIACILSTHYQYSPSKHTIYKDVFALGPDECIKYSHEGFHKTTNLKLKNIENYDISKIDEFESIIEKAIMGRTDSSWNIANSTGGWDSTFIITKLVELLGRDKVSSSTYNSILRDKSEWNIYEKTRAEKIAKHFGIDLIEYRFDFESPSLVDSMDEQLSVLRSHNAYNDSLVYFLMYKKLSKQYHSGTIFSGEASDSIQNFGFSQYVPFNHESYAFKEYADKMRIYLYSPDFMKKLFTGKYKSDQAFNIWKYISGKIHEEDLTLTGSKEDVLFKYLAPILFSQFTRIPFERILTSEELSDIGRNDLIIMLRNQYFDPVLIEFSEDNIYSCILNLYKNFHLQGPTMKMNPLMARCHGFKAVIPFLDTNVLDFMEKMPTSWGRGLEWNQTKFPLKSIARKNKNFPLKIVETGIHSYPSEVNPLLRDETYNFYFNSVATDYFKEVLRTYSYKHILDSTNFNIPYFDNLVDSFLNNKMDKIPNYYSLVRLINFVSIGWD